MMVFLLSLPSFTVIAIAFVVVIDMSFFHLTSFLRQDKL